eukprot:TRINITY_DN1085_c0_g1_i2.p1 TRINITY_DN1085_c0_g1~~TRINITY_DN1085_c0_g1_i2.p1  ORF type:complete len:148 (+),score=10.31 TRINITY_DN1085_c0_g1_i2:265-708(+)
MVIVSSCSPFFKSFFSNIVGCYLMGVVTQMSNTYKSPWAVFLLKIFGTGALGSLTTFSGWMVDTSQKIIDGYYTSGLFSIFLGFSTSYSAFMMGIHTISGIHSIITVYQKQDDLNLSMEKTLVKGENVTDPTSSLIPKQGPFIDFKK